MSAVGTRPPTVVEHLPNDGFLNSTPGTRAASGSAPLDEAEIVRRFDKNASIVLIGVRGAGKRSLGFIAATHLGRRFVAEGLYFQQITGISKVDYLNLHGRADFHRRALEVFRQMLEQNDHDCVIECGMHSLAKEAQEVLRQCAKSHPVIHVLHNFDHVGISNIKQIEQLKEAHLNHRTCSNFEFYNLYDCTCLAETEVDVKTFNPSSAYILQDVKAEFQDYVNFITGHTKDSFSGPFSLSALPLEKKPRSYATPLRLSELLAHSVNAGDLESGEDAVELIVDAWETDVKTVLSKQISVLRRKFGIPIILSLLEEGLDPSKPKPIAFSDLMDHGIRLGVDYIIIDASLPKDHQERLLLSKGRTKAIADYLFRDPAPGAWLHQGRISICERAEREGYDLVRLRQHGLERQDNADVQHFVRLASQSVDIPIIAYNLGCYSKSSKVFNKVLTPVERCGPSIQTGEELHAKGVIRTRDATAALFQCFEYDRLKFYVLGQSVFFSRSPSMYMAAYRLYGMGHSFSYQEVSSFDEILGLAKDSSFGGAAISFPFKQEAFDACSLRSPHASVIGSVNTLLPLRQLLGDKSTSLSEQANHRNKAGPVIGLYGDNTDWEGLYKSVLRKLSPRNLAMRARSTGLVLGAGGSARSSIYALLRLGCQTVYVHNRTYDKAVKVADHFNDWIPSREDTDAEQSVVVLQSGSNPWPQDAALPFVIVACVPTTTVSFDGRAGGRFELPEEWFNSGSGGVVADFSYNPPNTPLLEQVRRLREKKGMPWAIVTGVDIVYEQALLQFEQMTGYRAPRATMRKALAD